jgi:uncharacterized repeat protein (TIGR01451 family)
MFDSVNNHNSSATRIGSSAVNRKKRGVTINRAMMLAVFGMLLVATSLFSTSSVYSKLVGANSRWLMPPVAGTLNVKMTGTAVAAPTDTFTLRKQVFTGSTNCSTGGGAITDVTGVNAATGTPISFTSADSVLLTPFFTSDRNGQVSGFQNPDALTLNFLPLNAVCVAGFDTVSHNILAQYNPGVETLDAGCVNPKFLYNVGDTLCVRVSGSGGTAGTPWKMLGPFGGIPSQCNLFFADQNNTAETQTFSYTLPANNAAIPAGCAANPTTDIRGAWDARLNDNTSNFKAERQFRLHDPANKVADISISKQAGDNVFSGDFPQAGGIINYTLAVQNNGPDDAANVTVTEPVPASVTFISMTQTSGSPAFSCAPPAGGNVVCSLASFPAGHFASLVMRVSYANVLPANPINNTATISSSTADLFAPNNSSSAIVTTTSNTNVAQLTCPADIVANSTGPGGAIVNYGLPTISPPGGGGGLFAPTPIASGGTFPIGTTLVTYNAIQAGTCNFKVTVVDAQHSDLTITKSHSGDFVQGQVGAQYTLLVKNVGGVATSGAVAVVETPPVSMTVTALTGTNWTCTLSTLTCTRSDSLAANASYEPITVTVNVATYYAGSSNPNTATVSGGGQVYTGNDQATDSANILPLGSATGAALPPPTITKSFGAASIPVNGSTSLTFSITNPDGANPRTGVAFTDNLPAGLVVATPNGLSGTCGAGTITATAGSGTITLAGGTLAAGGNCTFSVNVTGTTAGVKNNSTQVTSIEAGPGNTTNASITVAAPPVIIKAFGAALIPQGASTTLTFTIQNNNAVTPLTGVGFSDTLPAGLVVATPNGLAGSCGGGTITATAGSGSVSLAGATLPQSSQCTFAVNVTGTSGGLKSNTTGNVTSTESGPGGTASASITVCSPPLITCPGGITKFADSGQLGATVNPGTPVASGGCPPVTITGVRSDGKALNALYPIGVTIITWTAKDASNQTATCAQSIAVMVPSGERPRRIPEEDEALLVGVNLLISCFAAFW